MMFRSLLILLFLSILVPGYSACPDLPDDVTAAVAISEACFCSSIAVEKGKDEHLVALARNYCSQREVSDTLLFCAYRSRLDSLRPPLFRAIVNCWMQQHRQVVTVVDDYVRTGKIREADTLCTILEGAGSVGSQLLMRWIDIKKVLDDLTLVPDFFCRIVDERPELLRIVTMQFGQLLREVERPRGVALLTNFADCIAPGTGKDSSDAMMWLIEQFGEKNSVAMQIKTVQQFVADKDNRSEILRLISLRYSDLDLPESALPVAQAAVLSARGREQKRSCAAQLSRVYSRLGRGDSAKVWLDRAGGILASSSARIAAVAVYQDAGALDSADAALARLPQSLARDTLWIRQLLLRDSAQRAFTEVCSLAILPENFPGALLWQVRCALFARRYDVATTLLTTLDKRQSVPDLASLTMYRYWCTLLMDDPEGLAKFSQIEYTLFKGDRSGAAAVVCSTGKSLQHGWRLALRVARKQLEHNEFTAALQTLLTVPAGKEPEYLLALAEVQMRKGDTKTSQATAGKVLTDFPESPYAAKARLLLVR